MIPRFTRTAAHADEFVRIRPGTDVAADLGHPVAHLRERLGGQGVHSPARLRHGSDPGRSGQVDARGDRTGHRRARLPAQARSRAPWPTTGRAPSIWCMGGTQHTNGNNNTRAYCALQLALGNIGHRVRRRRQHLPRPRQRPGRHRSCACCRHTLPGYYGLKTGSWKHWARVWDVDYDYLLGRFAEGPGADGTQGHPGVALDRWRARGQGEHGSARQLRAMVFWGHAPNSQTRRPSR